MSNFWVTLLKNCQRRRSKIAKIWSRWWQNRMGEREREGERVNNSCHKICMYDTWTTYQNIPPSPSSPPISISLFLSLSPPIYISISLFLSLSPPIYISISISLFLSLQPPLNRSSLLWQLLKGNKDWIDKTILLLFFCKWAKSRNLFLF